MAKAVDIKAAKERKQKKIVAIGGVLLVIVLFVQVPRTLKMMNGDAEPAAAAAPSPSAPAPDGTPAPTPAAPDSPVPDATVATASLVSFSRFASKDPFVQQVKEKEGASGEGSSADTSGEGAKDGSESDDGTAAPDPAGRTKAEIEVNGVAETVSVGTPFPVDTPMFLLESVSAKSVAIKVADGGSFATGATTLTLALGKPVTLVNTADGTRFVLLLKAVQ
ncbi:MAG: hypothetical protein WD249_07795 [Gaiellaceae bacterium]